MIGRLANVSRSQSINHTTYQAHSTHTRTNDRIILALSFTCLLPCKWTQAFPFFSLPSQKPFLAWHFNKRYETISFDLFSINMGETRTFLESVYQSMFGSYFKASPPPILNTLYHTVLRIMYAQLIDFAENDPFMNINDPFMLDAISKTAPCYHVHCSSQIDVLLIIFQHVHCSCIINRMDDVSFPLFPSLSLCAHI